MVWSNQNRIIQTFKKRGGFVLRVEEDILNAVKGAKRYKLLPVGETTPVIVEERYLKKAPKRKQPLRCPIYYVESSPKYKLGNFVRCGYDLVDFYSYIYENETGDYFYFRFYGLVVQIEEDKDWLFGETVYKVYCIDGLYRFFLEDEMELV